MEEKIRVLISEEDVNKKISEVASRISRDYEGKQVHLICILKGEIVAVSTNCLLTVPLLQYMEDFCISDHSPDHIPQQIHPGS